MKVVHGTVIGIDSKTTRIAFTVTTAHDAPPQMHIVTIPKATYDVKCALAYKAVREIVQMYATPGVDVYVFVEAPLVGRGIAASLQLAKIEGACIGGAASVKNSMRGIGKIAVYEVNVQTWKKNVIGTGNARKETVAEWCCKYWRQAFDVAYNMSGTVLDQDLIDSAAICYYGMRTLRLSNATYAVRRSTTSNSTAKKWLRDVQTGQRVYVLRKVLKKKRIYKAPPKQLRKADPSDSETS